MTWIPLLLAALVGCVSCQLQGVQSPFNSIGETTTTPKPLIPILRHINRVNEDGSYTFGYESGDGTYRVETRGIDGVTRGKYGYIDENGQLKEVDYLAGREFGYEPRGQGIMVPPRPVITATDETLDYDDGSGTTPSPLKKKKRPSQNTLQASGSAAAASTRTVSQATFGSTAGQTLRLQQQQLALQQEQAARAQLLTQQQTQQNQQAQAQALLLQQAAQRAAQQQLLQQQLAQQQQRTVTFNVPQQQPVQSSRTVQLSHAPFLSSQQQQAVQQHGFSFQTLHAAPQPQPQPQPQQQPQLQSFQLPASTFSHPSQLTQVQPQPSVAQPIGLVQQPSRGGSPIDLFLQQQLRDQQQFQQQQLLQG